MSKKPWTIMATAVKASTGEKTIWYESPDSKVVIESRKRAIPHANRSGVWYRTTYFVVSPDGTEKEYMTLGRAKEAAEEMGGEKHDAV